ncbi:MAG: hypothetical protein CL445_09340 [Acidimicrobiaceae bacterium]|jgi:uncharacterized protein (TIGR00369 family)|nr:hypothetical protein [Acidimicrobiaceae bacterium]MBS32611.1 hypothetical protein [Acidimicrobiaceae bacterium]|tara:strand:+ start:534 stop:977 length:444 start_codon:yes stop_codon:yes gene_type:complete
MEHFEPDSEIVTAIQDSFSKQGLMATIGAKLHLVASGEVRLRIEASESLTQHHGFLHAGIIGTILDSSCGWASQTLMPLGTEVLTVEYKLNLLRPAAGAQFEGRGTVLRAGTTLTAAEAAFYTTDNPDRLIATMTATLIGVRPPSSG